ncbi:hypothetical protein F2P81_021415 [Scophthalmus maximus]|uniref:Uncharacterized protein n=1 Tax=Scophthalmus maximus TaxID=52904 RepID=A0A6A4S3E2_SCOMX|nr:hypothetical protein F2P81_021415 [Scophthalmus maximus]
MSAARSRDDTANLCSATVSRALQRVPLRTPRRGPLPPTRLTRAEGLLLLLRPLHSTVNVERRPTTPRPLNGAAD